LWGAGRRKPGCCQYRSVFSDRQLTL
jgi:hypothetical protein